MKYTVGKTTLKDAAECIAGRIVTLNVMEAANLVLSTTLMSFHAVQDEQIAGLTRMTGCSCGLHGNNAYISCVEMDTYILTRTNDNDLHLVFTRNV